jgi:hypothetical protein
MKKLTPDLFVRLYMESHAAGHTMRQFADRIGLSYNHAYARAHHYRKAGVQLPALANGRATPAPKPSLDVASLNAIVADPAAAPVARTAQAAGFSPLGARTQRRRSGRGQTRRPVVLAR